MWKKSILCFYATALLYTLSFSQETFLNRKFQHDYGSPVFNPILNQLNIQWSHTVKCPSGELVTVGHTWVSGQSENILLTKRDPDGNIVFQVDQDVNNAGNNDYGIGVYVDASGDIYVCGTTDNGGSTDYDGVVMRFSSGGSLLNATTYAGPSGMNDVATDLKMHPTTNRLIVCLANENTTTSYDYLVLEMNAISLAVTNSAGYDGANLIDVPIGLDIDAASGGIMLIGGSQSSLLVSAYAVASYNASIAFISAARTDLTGTPYDQPLAFVKDASNNIYITGKTLSGTTYNIRTAKINANNTLAWNVPLDVNGLDDIGTSIALDPTNGDVIVGGLCTRSGNISDMICVRYNTSGSMVGTPYIQKAENPAGNAAIKKLCTNPAGAVYYVAGELGNSGMRQVVVGKLNASGTGGWEQKVTDASQDILPSDITVTPDGIFAISVLDSVTDSYIMTGYEELTLDTARVFLGGKPAWAKGELLVTFSPKAINKAVIDNATGSTEIRTFGDLSDFLTPAAFTSVSNAFVRICHECHIQAIKVYDMKTTDTVAISRQGENVAVPSFWSTLLLKFPNTFSEQQGKKVLDKLPSVVLGTQYNNFIALTSPPNDSLYAGMANLHPVGATTNAHINVEEAWNVATNCGSASIKGGVFDTGILWKHKDFGYTGSPTSGKIQGWHFGTGFGPSNAANGGVDIRQQTFTFPDWLYDQLDHGTAVAGIIGAERNNTSGIAGIAGGDGSVGNPGVSLFSLNVAAYKMYWLLSAYYHAHTGVTANNTNPKPYAYGVDFSNHSYKMESWFPADSFPLVRAQTHWANRLGVTFVAARGNDSTNNWVIPANFDPNWAISCGASNASGTKWSGSSYGSDVDIIAPGVYQIVTSLKNDRYYKAFAGTSSAAPHASGVVALLMSYMNDPQNPYMNLAPEDCDFILQRSATDVGPAGYDSLNGWGRLNAGKALRMVEKPVRIFYHFGTNYRYTHSITKSMYANWDTIRLTEFYENYASPRVTYPAGKYIVKTYQVNATVNHAGLYPTDSLMYYWPRHSASHVYALPTAQKKLDMHERVIINSLNGSSASLTGYVYQVKDSTGANVGWWPCDTSFTSGNLGSLFEYSVLSKNKAVGIKENRKESISVDLFPNPASQQQTIHILSDQGGNCRIELYDVMGRYIRLVYDGKTTIGNNSLTHDVAGLTNSMYIYLIKMDGKTVSKKFIKE